MYAGRTKQPGGTRPFAHPWDRGESKKPTPGIFKADGPVQEMHDRPRTVPVSFDPGALIAIDAWALDNTDIKSRAEAVRRLVEMNLAAASASGPTG
jgi:hypothetical protein